MTDRHELLAASVARNVPDLTDAVIQCHQFGISSPVIVMAMSQRHGDAATHARVLRIIGDHRARQIQADLDRVIQYVQDLERVRIEVRKRVGEYRAKREEADRALAH